MDNKTRLMGISSNEAIARNQFFRGVERRRRRLFFPGFCASKKLCETPLDRGIK